MKRAWHDKSEFKSRVRCWAGKLEVSVTSIALRPMRTKWASCSTAGALNFNVDLLGFSREVWDYVIVHELLHFVVPNHGKLWRSLMLVHLGDYEERAAELQQAARRAAGDEARVSA